MVKNDEILFYDILIRNKGDIVVKNREDKIFQIVSHIFLIGMTIAVIVPFLLLFMSSITDETTLIKYGYTFFPQKLSLEAYRYILQQGNVILKAYGITIFVTVVGTAINILITTMMAYGLSIKELPFRKSLTFYVVLTMLFNGGLVPTYLMYTGTFHIKNTIFAQIIPGLLLSPMNVLLIRTYINRSIPKSLFEAAAIDGAGHMKLFTNIVLPLGKPIIVTMATFAGLGYWNDWTNGLYYLSGQEGQNLYSVQNLLNQMIANIQFLTSAAGAGTGASIQIPATGVRMAIAFVAIVPILMVFPSLQKYFQKGIMLGGVKE